MILVALLSVVQAITSPTMYAAVYNGDLYVGTGTFTNCASSAEKVERCLAQEFPHRVYLQERCLRKALVKNPLLKTLIRRNEDGIWVEKVAFSAMQEMKKTCD